MPGFTLIFVFIIIIFAAVICLMILKRYKSIPADQPFSGGHIPEKIYVSANRVQMISFVLGLVGVLFIVMASLGVAVAEGFAILVPVVFVCIGLFLVYKGITFYQKRSSMVQLEIGEEGIYHKPLKWYSYGRGGHANVLSVYLAADWRFTAYQNLSHVSLQESFWLGDAIDLVTTNGKREKLLLIIDDNETIRKIYQAIQARIEAGK